MGIHVVPSLEFGHPAPFGKLVKHLDEDEVLRVQLAVCSVQCSVPCAVHKQATAARVAVDLHASTHHTAL